MDYSLVLTTRQVPFMNSLKQASGVGMRVLFINLFHLFWISSFSERVKLPILYLGHLQMLLISYYSFDSMGHHNLKGMGMAGCI